MIETLSTAEIAAVADSSIPLAQSWAEFAAGLGSLFAIVVAIWLGLSELQRSRREREAVAERESLSRARRVVAWLEADTAFKNGEPAGGKRQYLVFNGSGGPIRDVSIFQGTKQVEGLSVVPPAEHPQVVRTETIDPPHFGWAHVVLRIHFTDADGNMWESSDRGRIKRVSSWNAD